MANIRLENAARELIAEQGEAGLTVAALAAALGIRPPSLYKHIRSLGALKESLARRAWSELADRFGELARRDADPRQLARAWWRYQVDHPALCRLAQADWAQRSTAVAAARARAEAQAGRIFEAAGMDRGESEMAWRAMRAIVEGLAQQGREALHADQDMEATFSRSIGALVRGWRRSAAG